MGLGIPNMRVGRVSVKFARRAGWLRKGAMELNTRLRCGGLPHQSNFSLFVLLKLYLSKKNREGASNQISGAR